MSQCVSSNYIFKRPVFFLVFQFYNKKSGESSEDSTVGLKQKSLLDKTLLNTLTEIHIIHAGQTELQEKRQTKQIYGIWT